MKKTQTKFKINLIGEQSLSELTKDELSLLVSYFIDGLKKYMAEEKDYKTEKASFIEIGQV